MKCAAWMSMLAWAITISSYYLCAALLHDITHPLDVFKWAISNPSQKSLAPSPIGGILILPKTNIDAIFGHSFALFRRQSEWIEFIIAVAAMITALIFVFITVRKVPIVKALKSLRQCAPEMSESRRQIVPVLIAWIGTYILFLLFWEPLIYFRAFYTPALALGIGFVMSNYHRVIRNRPSGAAALAAAGLALFNLAFYIGPYMRADSNVLVAADRNANSVWNEPTQ